MGSVHRRRGSPTSRCRCPLCRDKAEKRIFRIIGILLNTLGVGLIMAAHPLAADFRLTAQTLSLCSVPAAVLLAAYLSILLFPRARRWCGVGCIACLIALVVLFAVLWSKRGAALYGFPLYSTVFVFFYAVTLVPEADDLKTTEICSFFPASVRSSWFCSLCLPPFRRATAAMRTAANVVIAAAPAAQNGQKSENENKSTIGR